jgi:excisionase family DNA binding protein
VTLRYLSVAECADLLAVDHKTVRRLIEREELPAFRVGRVLRIDPADLEALRWRPRESSSTVVPLRRRQVTGEFSRLAREAPQ